jgi:hypothetical protein
MAAWMVASALPARADDTAANNRSHETAKRSTASLGTGTNGATAATPTSAGFTNGFVYTPSPQPIVGIRGRLNVGKSGVYVPYYGNVGTDPLHPNVEGVAGIGYGFHSWDISVINNGAAGLPAVPGSDPPKANPSLSFAIHF